MRAPTHLLAVAVLVAAAAGAAAQGSEAEAQTRTEVSAETPRDPVPRGATIVVPVEVAYAYQEGSSGASEGPTSIFVSARESVDWIEATVSPWILEAPVEAGGGEVVLETDLTLAVDDDAPTGVQETVEVHVVAAENDALESTSGKTAVPLQAVDDADEDGNQTTSTSANGSGSDDGSAVPAPSPLTAALAAAGLGYARRRRRGPAT